MKTSTLFRAFQHVMKSREVVRARRTSIFRDTGIAVDGDKLAIKWQRRDRQAQKIATEIERRINQAEAKTL